ncbi:MAG: seryl-tRNA synthetase, partial [Thermoleophilaceae bacterium]|nr:seryl-tRNA synthetase [Thermoleophilaceae bacterium]
MRAGLARRKAPVERLDDVIRLDARRRELLPEVESLRATQNKASEAIAEAKRSGTGADAAIAEMREVASRVKEMQAELAGVEEELKGAMPALPNLPLDSSPVEEEVLREVGEAGKSGRDHLELLGDMVDMEAGARLSGSRFVYLRGPLVMLEFALVRWALELLSDKGFEPVIPPVLVREEPLYGTGFLPDTEQQIYKLPEDDLYLVGTSEVALAYLHAGQILEGGTLPRRYAGFSSCFRREAGAGGKDTRGMFRVHQFDKLEMFTFVRPEDSPAEHDRLLAIEEAIF